jgi:hypothetical protein
MFDAANRGVQFFSCGSSKCARDERNRLRRRDENGVDSFEGELRIHETTAAWFLDRRRRRWTRGGSAVYAVAGTARFGDDLAGAVSSRGAWHRNRRFGVRGSPFSVVFNIKVPDHIENPAGGTLPVTSIEIATSGAIMNIPASFSYACNPPDCVFPSNTISCVALTGTPQPGEEGVYDLKVNAIIHSIIPIAIVIPDDLGPETIS